MKWIEDGIELETCPICYDYAQPHEMFEVPTCFHRVCISCMKKQVTELVHGWKATHCPCCKTEILIEDCKSIDDPGHINIIIHHKRKDMIHVAVRPQSNSSEGCQHMTCMYFSFVLFVCLHMCCWDFVSYILLYHRKFYLWCKRKVIINYLYSYNLSIWNLIYFIYQHNIVQIHNDNH